jgi:hypothetical protein
MRGYEVANANAYRLEDAKTGLTLLLIPTYTYGTPQLALCAAGRQARRHAASGTWVLVTGADRNLLYVGDRCFVQCEGCSKWMLPRRRGNFCPECRTDDEGVGTAVNVAKSGRSRPKRRRRPPVGPHQLTLPEL